MAAQPTNGSIPGASPSVTQDDFPIERPAKRVKLQGRAFYESIGSPKWVVAPMVDQSEFAWRLLTRSFMTPATKASVLAYSPMLHARLFASNSAYRSTAFQPTREFIKSSANGKEKGSKVQEVDHASKDTTPFLDGNPAIDRPLFVQFCANDPDAFLESARHVAPYCDAVDLNLGCPQGIAKRGHYGAFLQEDWKLIHNLINNLHENLDIPITAKFRIQETKEKTLEYAKMILSAGANIITVHGRRREQKGHMTGVADWEYIRYLRESLPPETVIFANGNILERGDLEKCLEATGADGVMSAEGNLHNPAVFADEPPEGEAIREFWRGRDGRNGWRIDAVMRRYYDILYRYCLERDPPERPPLFIIEDLPESELEAPTQPETNIQNGFSTGTKRPAEEDTPTDNSPQTEEPPSKKLKLSKNERKKLAKAAAKEQRKMNASNGVPTTNPNDAYITKAQAAKAGSDPNLSAMQAHLFSLLRVFVSVPDPHHARIRDQLARSKSGDMASFEEVLRLVEARVREGIIEYYRNLSKTTGEENSETTALEKPIVKTPANNDAKEETSSAATIARVKRPWWVCQSFVRPLPSEALVSGALTLSRKEKERLAERYGGREGGKSGVGNGEEVASDSARILNESEDHQKEEGKIDLVGLDDGKGESKEIEVAKDGLVCG